MGRRNYLIEGVSGTGKTSVCDELLRRGYPAIHGDRELAYQGDPATGIAVTGSVHAHHLWRVDAVKALADNKNQTVTFFCGGSRNHQDFIDLFDDVFVLEVDLATLRRRLADRPDDEFGGMPAERELIERLHRSKDSTPDGIAIDAAGPLVAVVDRILQLTALHRARS